jgi:hypothetical protein
MNEEARQCNGCGGRFFWEAKDQHAEPKLEVFSIVCMLSLIGFSYWLLIGRTPLR